MGVSLDYFFKYPKDIDELVGEIGSNFWSRDWRKERGSYWGVFLGITFWIECADGFANDGDKDFESYSYDIGTKMVYRPAIFHHTQLAVTLSLIYMLYERVGIKDGMLVWDVQRLLAKYEERDEALYDLVSDRPFTNFSEHMKMIETRVPQDWRD